MYYLLLLLAIYGLLIYIFPKGNIIHEGLHLPVYHFRTRMISLKKLEVKKHQYGQHKRQYLLIIKAKQHNIKRSNVIFYYHGGAWSLGNPEMFIANAKIFAELGYTVIMPSYRRIPRYNYYDIRADLNEALLFTSNFVKKTNATGIILGGMSAGGNLVALALYDQAQLQAIGIDKSLFKGIFLCGAPLDLSKMNASILLQRYAGKQGSSIFEKANPINHIQDKEDTPILCIHGHKDGLVAYASSTSFIKKLQSVQTHSIQFFSIKKGSHLDSGAWVYDNNEVRQILLNFIETISEKP